MDDDEERGDLVFIGRLPAMKMTNRTPRARGERQREAVRSAGSTVGRNDVAEHVDTARTEGLRGLLQIALHSSSALHARTQTAC